MIIIKLVTWLFVCCSFGCASINDAGRIYFKLDNKVIGVEPVGSFLARVSKEKELRSELYGKAQSERIIKCSILRNQFYVASIKYPSNKEIVETTRIFEEAYQQNDELFLQACDQISGTQIGRNFLSAQQQYLIARGTNLQ